MNSENQNFKDIIHSLDQIEVPESIFHFAKELPYHDESIKRKHKAKSFSKSLIKLSIAIVAILVVGISIGSYVSPAVAAYINSLFDRSNLDKGLQEAAQQGYFQKTKATVTDQGITFQVHEVMADSKRVILSYSLQKEGKDLDPTILFEKEEWGTSTLHFLKDPYSFSVKDQENNPVTVSNNYHTKSGRLVFQSIQPVIYPHPPYADVIFKLNNEVKSNQLIAHIALYKIGNVKGNWDLTVPIDMKKSLKATKILPIERNYTTPQGLNIELQNITYTPMSTSLDIQTQWTKEAIRQMNKEKGRYISLDEKGNKISGSPHYFHDFDYDIVDEHGTIVMTSTAEAKDDSKQMIFSHSDFKESGKSILWHQSFIPVFQDKKLTFLLKSITRTEYPNISVTFNPNKAENENVQLEYKGRSYRVQNLEMVERNDDEKTMVIEMEGLAEVALRDFELIDEKGKVYAINYERSKVTWLEEDPNSSLKKVRMQYMFDGFKEVPKELKLTLVQETITYKDVNWSVPIN